MPRDISGVNLAVLARIASRFNVALSEQRMRRMLEDAQEEAQRRERAATQKRVRFEVKRQTNFGERVSIVGSHAALGSWDPANACRMSWSEGHLWNCEVPFSWAEDAVVQYKCVIVKDHTLPPEVYWKRGNNLHLHLGNIPCATVSHPNLLTVVRDVWDEEEPPSPGVPGPVLRNVCPAQQGTVCYTTNVAAQPHPCCRSPGGSAPPSTCAGSTSSSNSHLPFDPPQLFWRESGVPGVPAHSSRFAEQPADPKYGVDDERGATPWWDVGVSRPDRPPACLTCGCDHGPPQPSPVPPVVHSRPPVPLCEEPQPASSGDAIPRTDSDRKDGLRDAGSRSIDEEVSTQPHSGSVNGSEMRHGSSEWSSSDFDVPHRPSPEGGGMSCAAEQLQRLLVLARSAVQQADARSEDTEESQEEGPQDETRMRKACVIARM